MFDNAGRVPGSRAGLLGQRLRRGPAGVDGFQIFDHGRAVTPRFGVHQKGRQPGRLAVEFGDVRVVLQGVHAHAHQLGEGHVEVVDQQSLPRGLHPFGIRPAEREVAPLVLLERFHVAGDRFDDPEVVLAANVLGHLPRFLKELMRRLVIDGAWLLVWAGKKIGVVCVIEVDSQRHRDLRLSGEQGRVVFAAVAEIVTACLGSRIVQASFFSKRRISSSSPSA